MKEERRRRSRKEFLIIALTAMACGLSSIALGFFFLDSDESIGWCVCFCLAILCLAIELPALVKAAPSQEELFEQYTTLMLTMLTGLGEKRVFDTFQQKGFSSLDNRFLMKKVRRWPRSAVSCYIRWISMENDADMLMLMDTVSATLDDMTALERQDLKWERGSSCLILFLEMEQISAEISQTVMETSSPLMRGSITLPFKKAKTLVMVLVEKTSGRGCFWGPIKIGQANVYGQGCKLLKTYFT